MLRGKARLRFRGGKNGLGPDYDVRTGSRIKPPTKEQQLEKFAQLPVCNLPKDGQRCRWQKRMEKEQRCLAVTCGTTDCRHLGEVEPLRTKVATKNKERAARVLIVEEAPKINV